MKLKAKAKRKKRPPEKSTAAVEDGVLVFDSQEQTGELRVAVTESLSVGIDPTPIVRETPDSLYVGRSVVVYGRSGRPISKGISVGFRVPK